MMYNCCYCGGYFEEGFYIQDGLAKYCSEDCLLDAQYHSEFEEHDYVLEDNEHHSKAS